IDLFACRVVEGLDDLLHSGHLAGDYRGDLTFLLGDEPQKVDDPAFANDLDRVERDLLRVDEGGTHFGRERGVIGAVADRARRGDHKFVHDRTDVLRRSRYLARASLDGLVGHFARQQYLTVEAVDIDVYRLLAER